MICRACGSYNTSPSSAAEIFLELCNECGAYNNLYELENVLERQKSYHEEWWKGNSQEDLLVDKNSLLDLAESFVNSVGKNSENIKALELGSGRGCMIAALDQVGVSAIGVEPSSCLCELGRQAFDLKTSFYINDTAQNYIKNSKKEFDLIILWHVIEHVEEPGDLMKMLAGVLSHEGVVVLQIPLPRPDHVFPEHLFFPTLTTFSYWAKETQLYPNNYSFDFDNYFMTVFLSREREAANNDFQLSLIVESSKYLKYIKDKLEEVEDERSSMAIAYQDLAEESDTLRTKVELIESDIVTKNKIIEELRIVDQKYSKLINNAFIAMLAKVGLIKI